VDLSLCEKQEFWVMASNPRALGIAGLLVATSAWGSLFLVGKSVLPHVNPVWFTFIRYTLATAVFVVLTTWRDGCAWRKLREHAPRLAIRGFAGYGFFSVLVLLGLAHSMPSHGAVIMATMPITTQLLRWARDDIKPTRAVLLSTALALLGVIAVSGVLTEHGAAQRGVAMGDLLMLVGTLGWIAYTRGAAKLPSLSVLEYSTLTALAAWPLLLLTAVAGAATSLAAAPTMADLGMSWHALLYIAAVPSVIAVLSYNFGVKTLGVLTGTAFLNFVPVSVVLMNAALGKAPQPHELAGLLLVVGALLNHTMTQRRLEKAPPRALPGRIANPTAAKFH
jgi:drug/metabolite transporter (DMT)-like permease